MKKSDLTNISFLFLNKQTSKIDAGTRKKIMGLVRQGHQAAKEIEDAGKVLRETATNEEKEAVKLVQECEEKRQNDNSYEPSEDEKAAIKVANEFEATYTEAMKKVHDEEVELAEKFTTEDIDNIVAAYDIVYGQALYLEEHLVINK